MTTASFHFNKSHPKAPQCVSFSPAITIDDHQINQIVCTTKRIFLKYVNPVHIRDKAETVKTLIIEYGLLFTFDEREV